MKLLSLISFMILCQFALLAKADIAKDYQTFSSGKATLTPDELTQIQKYHIVLAAGILNEAGRGPYFLELVKNLEELGITVSRIYPSSLNTADKESPLLAAQIENEFIAGGKKPIIYVGHSQGGQKGIVTLLDHPDLVTDGKIAQLTTLQSAISGNELFDNIPFANLFSKFSIIPQLRALSERNLIEDITDRQTALFNKDPELYNTVSQSVRFILTSDSAFDMSLFVLPLGLIIQGFEGTPTDGLVATKHMMLKDFGLALGYIKNIDHLGFVYDSKEGYEKRAHAFALALVRTSLKNLSGQTAEYESTTRKLKKQLGVK